MSREDDGSPGWLGVVVICLILLWLTGNCDKKPEPKQEQKQDQRPKGDNQ